MTRTPTAAAVRREYGALAARYDRRWARYVERSLALLEPWLRGAELGSLLDLGSGTSELLPRLAAWDARFTRYTGLDVSAHMLRMGRAKAADAARAGFVAASADALPFRSAAFDTVVTASSLHYWESPGAAFADIHRVLRPGGRLVVMDWRRDHLPMRLADLGMRLAGVRYVRVYTRAEAAGLLRGAGFRIARESEGSAGSFWRLMLFEAHAEPR